MSETTIHDSLGHSIQAGDEVIYNLSGELALGRVISAESKTVMGRYYNRPYTTQIIKIQHIQGGDRPKNGISAVRNPLGIVVLKGLN